MNLKNTGYSELAKNIIKNNSRIIIYGAGMIGQIVVPYIVETYHLHSYIDYYVDMDDRKIGKQVSIGFSSYDIRSPEILDQISGNTVILLTNSKFYPVIEFLDTIEALKNVDCYIVPMMQKIEQRTMIPKIIHYCWFGRKEMPDLLKECMKTWQRFCHDYEFIRWDEESYDVSKYAYTKQAYESGKYGFVTDVVRLDVLYQYGGIYMDTDVKLIKSFNEMIYNKGFVGVERWGNINTGGGVGAVKEHPMIKEMLDYRLKYPFIYEDGSLNVETNGLYETMPFTKYGLRIDNTLQIVNEMTVYPASVFHPYDYMSGEEKIEDNTIGIHYFYGGWMDEEDRRNRAKTREKYVAVLKRIQEDA